MDRYDTTTQQHDVPTNQLTSVVRRRQHQALFDAILKEIFLAQHVQLREPIAEASKHTVVYGGLYQGEEVAVKILTLASEDLRDAISSYGAFKVECEKTMVLSRRSDSILQVHEYGDAELLEDMPAELAEFFPLQVVPFMITERAPYGSLDKVNTELRRLPGFSRMSLIEAMVGATEGIKEAHLHSVAHRDIKPQNILIFGPREAKISDFGIARWRSRISGSGAAELTPKYSSPEQAFHALTGQRENLVGEAGDVYSWAIMVYELVTGKHPFDWAIKEARGTKNAQKLILRAIAANDRRGFRTTGDITFDALIDHCTRDFKQRINDIAKANSLLKQFVERHTADEVAGSPVFYCPKSESTRCASSPAGPVCALLTTVFSSLLEVFTKLKGTPEPASQLGCSFSKTAEWQ